MIYSTAFVSLFKIAGCFIRNIAVSQKEIIIEVYRRRKTGACPTCAKRTKRVHKRAVRKVLHEIVGIQRVLLSCAGISIASSVKNDSGNQYHSLSAENAIPGIWYPVSFPGSGRNHSGQQRNRLVFPIGDLGIV